MYGLYVIYDKVAEEAGPVFSAKNDGIALRSCRQIMADVDRVQDYKILCIANFDPSTCVVVSSDSPREIIQMVDVEEVIK